MNSSAEICLIAAAVLLYGNFLLICSLLIKRLGIDSIQLKYKKQKTLVLQALFGSIPSLNSKLSPRNYFEIKQVVRLNQQAQENLEKYIDLEKNEQKFIKKLNSRSAIKRMEAAIELGLLATKNCRKVLESKIIEEKNISVKLFLASALSDIGNSQSIPVLVYSLINSKKWYREKVNMLICDFGEAFNSYLPSIIMSDKIAVKELIVDFAAVYFSDTLKSYLINIINLPAELSYEDEYTVRSNQALKYKGARILANFYPRTLDDEKYLNSPDLELKNIAVTALANFNPDANLKRLIDLLHDDELARTAIHGCSSIVEQHPEYLTMVAKKFAVEPNNKVKQRIAAILAGKIEYFIMQLKNPYQQPVEIIKQIIMQGRSSEFIDFLNKNQDIDLENDLLDIVKDILPHSSDLNKEFCTYLNERLLQKCGLSCYMEPQDPKVENRDLKQIFQLYLLLGFVVIIVPVIYTIRHFDLLNKLPWLEQLKIFVVDFNYYLAFYSIAVNMIYLVLLLLSYYMVKRQSKLWRIKNISLLFKKRMLPSVSIIAPAFNEEKTIIESANSLLNLKYPDYDLIIVNDGSKDSTLDVLIKYYDLTRVDYIIDYQLKTRPVRGIYMNRSLPKLIVVDKENGGKADSLNAGINISRKEYFCGIDADSLLEDDALLKLAALTLDEGVETPALGGNIFPINGCTIERGQLNEIRIPSKSLARFQNIEYIRAFMAGRLGWAALNSLLIISGAFGLFRKERIIGIGGYLSSSGRYRKDTVGEDMELVVRINRLMHELKYEFRIGYAFNANCWTEVPEDLKSLKRQRYRWHRGLIDILLFHKKMLFNPCYGRTGLFALPYFFIFEIIGPMIEFQGYLMVIIAAVMGLLNGELALLLFVSAILMGVFISVSALLIAEKDLKYFSLGDIFLLIFYAFIENFGPRQSFSLWRVGGYINMLKNPNGWEKAERKGFAVSPQVERM